MLKLKVSRLKNEPVFTGRKLDGQSMPGTTTPRSNGLLGLTHRSASLDRSTKYTEPNDDGYGLYATSTRNGPTNELTRTPIPGVRRTSPRLTWSVGRFQTRPASTNPASCTRSRKNGDGVRSSRLPTNIVLPPVGENCRILAESLAVYTCRPANTVSRTLVESTMYTSGPNKFWLDRKSV